jgi:hypothetical protein
MHETGHRYSFGHAEVWVTRDGFVGMRDPLDVQSGGPASQLPVGAKSYTDETDAMACCFGDYSVYAKLMVSPFLAYLFV